MANVYLIENKILNYLAMKVNEYILTWEIDASMSRTNFSQRAKDETWNYLVRLQA